MNMNDENLSVDSEGDLSKDRQLKEQIVCGSKSAPKENVPIYVELKKTVWDKTVQGLQLVSSFAMVIVTAILVIFAYKQWNVATRQLTAAQKQADAAQKQVEAANKQINVAEAQSDLISRQAAAVEKQAALAKEQLNIAKAQSELVMRMNEEAKKSTLKVNLVVGASYIGSDDVKGEIEMVFVNPGPRPTAILSVYLRTKQGSYFKRITEPDRGKLPLNIGPWSADKISFSLNKDDIKQLADIVVTDIDGKLLPPVKPTQWNATVKLKGIGAVATPGSIMRTMKGSPTGGKDKLPSDKH